MSGKDGCFFSHNYELEREKVKNSILYILDYIRIDSYYFLLVVGSLENSRELSDSYISLQRCACIMERLSRMGVYSLVGIMDVLNSVTLAIAQLY